VPYLRRSLPGRIRHALEELPVTLDETYERALRDLDEANWELAHRLLQCVAVASRPLRVEELAGFLGFDFTAGSIPTFHAGWLLEDPVDAVLSTTLSLLAIVNVDGSTVIQFSHFSVKEFLTSSRLAESSDIILHRYHVSMTHAHTLAAQACLGMLLHLDKNITRDDLEKFPLAEYAAEHWVDHVRFEDVSGKVEDGMKLLFDPSKFHFAVWLWIHDPEDPYWRRDRREERPSQPRGSPLHYAALCGLDAIVKFLVIERSQDVHCRGFQDNWTALHLACRRGHVGVACILLDNGADAEARDRHKSTPLHLASGGGHVGVVRVLLDRGTDTAAKDEENITPADLAFLLGQVEVVNVFLELGVSGAIRTSQWTPLQRALFEGNIEAIRVLIERGAVSTAPADARSHLLQTASLGGHVEVIQVLLEHGIDVTAKSDDGSTALFGASIVGHVEMARCLLEHGLEPTAQNKDGITSLHFASFGGHVEVARLLLDRGADVTTQYKDGATPLHFASCQGQVAVARLLLERGVDATSQTKDGTTPLHLAAAEGYLELTHLLLKHGADAIAQDDFGVRPLDMALTEEHAEIVHVLLEHGAGATAQDNQGDIVASNNCLVACEFYSRRLQAWC
jgi:ankyrin repeat protein